VVNRPREWIRPLRNPAEPLTQQRWIDVRGVDILAVEQNTALEACSRNDVVGAVEASQQRGLAAARRSDERRHFIPKYVQADVLERFFFTIPEVDRLNLDFDWMVMRVIGSLPKMQREIDQAVR